MLLYKTEYSLMKELINNFMIYFNKQNANKFYLYMLH